MAEKNILMQRKNVDGTFDVYYPKTKVGNLVDGGSGILDALKTVDGAGSGLDADLVRGIDVVSMLERNAYDDYLRTMELYYTGHFGGPAIAGFKGMTFDGFMDKSRVNTGLTTAQVDTSLKEVYCLKPYLRPVAVAMGTDILDFQNTGPKSWPNLTNQIDEAGEDTRSTLYLREDDGHDGTYYNYTFRYDLGSVMLINSISVFGHYAEVSGANTYYRLMQCAYSADGISWTKHPSDVGYDFPEYYDNGEKSGEKVIELSAPFMARYIAIEVRLRFSRYSTYYTISDVRVLAGYVDSVLQSTEKTLLENTTNVILYISAKKPSGTSYTPLLSVNGGSSFVTMPLVSSRTDPLYSDFTEYKHQIDAQGKDVVLKVNLNPGNETATPTIKRYGLYWV